MAPFFSLHVSPQVNIYKTGTRDFAIFDKRMCEWRDLEVQRPRHHLISWECIQQNTHKIQSVLDKAVRMPAAKSHFAPSWRDILSLVSWKSWNLSEQIFEVHSLRFELDCFCSVQQAICRAAHSLRGLHCSFFYLKFFFFLMLVNALDLS